MPPATRDPYALGVPTVDVTDPPASSRAQTLDWLIVLAVAATSVTGVGLERAWEGGAWSLAAAGLATALPLALRRTHPLVCAVLVGAALVVQVLLGGSLHFGSFIAALVAMFSVARFVASVARSAAGGVLLATGALAASAEGLAESPTDIVFPLFYFSAGWALGRGVRALEERTARLRQVNEVLARDREISAQLAVAEERMRMARELHDVVAHTVMVMVWQAEAAEELLRQGADDAADDAAQDRPRAALRTIQDAGRRGLADLRSLVEVLREDSGVPAATPRLDDLEALSDLMSRSGLQVDLRLDVPARTRSQLPAELGPTVYRLVQESLTNVIRHSAAAKASVQVRNDPHGLHVRIVDDGPVRTMRRPGSGHGISGMRERVMALGGTVTAQPHGDGYLVEASLPLIGSLT